MQIPFSPQEKFSINSHSVFTPHKKTKGAQLLKSLLFTGMKFEILYLDLNKPAKKRYDCRTAPYFTMYAPFVLKKQ